MPRNCSSAASGPSLWNVCSTSRKSAAPRQSGFGTPPTSVMTGTSMAAPHVTGYMALYKQRVPNATVSQVKSALYSHSTKNTIDEYFPGMYRDDLVYTYAVAWPLTVKAAPKRNRTRLFFDVNPNVGSQSWTVQVQKRQNGKWRTKKVLETRGTAERRTIDVKRGRWRVVVKPGQYGYGKAISNTVFIRR